MCDGAGGGGSGDGDGDTAHGHGAAAVAVGRSRVSGEQLDVLLSFMEEHADFAAGKQSVYSRFSASRLWRLLAERLNATARTHGGARKSPDKWCRYWADIKYKARKKSAAGGALGDLSLVEERLRTILDAGAGGGGGGGGGAGRHDDDERDRGLGVGHTVGVGVGAEEEACSEAGSTVGGARGGVSTEELLAEAAMRSALAAEKQAEAVAQGVELLRELVGVVRERLPLPAPPPPPPPPCHAPPHETHLQALAHHHRL